MRRSKKTGLKMGHFVFSLSLVSALGTAAALWIGYSLFRTEFPDTRVLKTQFPVVHYHGKDLPPTITLQKLRPVNWVSLKDVSPHAIGAIVVSEDWAFYQHQGYDVNQMREAFKEDWEAGSFVRGASTITQQVARNVFLDKDKNLWRKVKELILAVEMEKHVGKKRILESYLNIAEWGEGIFGIVQASKRYFHKPPSDLSAKEGAFLAMLLPSPKRYAQSFYKKHLTDYARETVDSILNKMTQAHYLKEEELGREIYAQLPFEEAQLLTPAPESSPSIENPFPGELAL